MEEVNNQNEQNNQMNEPVATPEAVTSADPALVPKVAQPVPATDGVVYGSFLPRFLASLIDGVLLAVVGGLFGGLFGGNMSVDSDGGFSSYNPIGSLIYWVYMVVMDVKFGATLGKMALGLRVQDAETGNNVDWIQAILREIVGKFVSGLVFLLGYFAIIWDKKNQGWHDKIAKTVVIKIKK